MFVIFTGQGKEMKNLAKHIPLNLFILVIAQAFYSCVQLPFQKEVKNKNQLTEQFTEGGNSFYYIGHWKSTEQKVTITTNGRDDVLYSRFNLIRSAPQDFQSALDNGQECHELDDYELSDLAPEATVVLHSYFNEYDYYMIAQMTYEVLNTDQKIICTFSIGQAKYETVGAAQATQYEYVYLTDLGYSFAAKQLNNSSFQLNFSQN